MLTDTTIKNLKPKDKRYFSKRERGLCVRVETSGLKAWYFIYDLNHKRVRYCFGHYSKNTGLAWARSQVEAMRSLLARGTCPKAHHEEQARLEKQKAAERQTFARLLDTFEQNELPKRNLKTAHEKMRILRRDFLPHWHHTELHRITRASVHRVLDSINGDSARRHAHTHLNDLFKYALSRELMSANPAADIKTPAPNTRTRHLSESEIRYFWLNIDSAKVSNTREMNPEVRRVLKLLLLTGQRRAEIVNATMDQINGDWLNLEETKNGEPHRVYLSPMTKGLLHSELTGRVFSVHVDTVTKQLREWVKHSAQEPYTVHDLRRTVGTSLARLGVSQFDLGRILNHTDHSVSGIYNRYSYDKEKKNRLLKWERELMRIANNRNNVVVGDFNH